MAHTYAVGDSIAVGCGQTGKVDHAYATSGMMVRNMGAHFAEVTAAAQPGDTVIVSAGYNGGINSKDKAELVEWISTLTHKGVHVGILNLREKWPNNDGYAARIASQTRGWNATLSDIAAKSGATFVHDKDAQDIVNTIPGGEIHGHFGAMVDQCFKALKVAPGPVSKTASVTSALGVSDIVAVQQLGLQEHLNLGTYGAAQNGVDGNLGRLTAKAILELEKQHPDELIKALGKDKAQAIEMEAHNVLEHTGHTHGLPHRHKAAHHRE